MPLRNSHRFGEILEVLARYGFGSLLRETGLDRLLARGRALFSGESAKRFERLPDSVRIRMALEELGPTFIKLGQVLSTRPDLIPVELAKEFRKLTNRCPTVAYEKIRLRLEDEFGPRLDELFTSIEETPLASGSLAQTHRAQLKDGPRVVLKILKPDIEDTIRADLEILEQVASFVENYFGDQGYSPVGVVREFSRLLHRELDLVREGRATDRLRQFFEDDPEIHFTQVYWEATTKKVLALEEVQGLLLADVQPETLTQAERHRAVKRGTDAVFRMCLELGFFHADPHPGNIFLLPDGGVCFIDCGLVGYLDTRTIEQLASLARAVSCADLDQTLRLTLALTDADPSLENNQALRAEAWDLIAQFQADSLEQLDLGETLEGLFEVFKKYQIRCPSNLVFLIKALATVQGVALELDPKFDWLEHTRPFIERMVARQYGPTALLNRLWRSTLNYVELAEDLPNEIRTISAQIRRRDFSIRLEHDGLERLKNTVDRASRHISTALILAAMLISGALLLRSDATLVWWSPVTWLLAGLYAVAAGYVAFLILGPLTSKD